MPEEREVLSGLTPVPERLVVDSDERIDEVPVKEIVSVREAFEEPVDNV